MDPYECISARRSIRKYLQKPVDFNKLALILEAGSKAPSAGNLQDYRFVVITEKDKIRAIADHCTDQFWIAEAPVIIAVCSDTESAESYYGLRGQRLYSVQNSAAAIQNMLLAAHSLGLGTCWIGSFNEDYMSEALKIPDKVRVQSIITLGYADGAPDIKSSRELGDMVFFNVYGNKIRNMNALLKEYSKEISKGMKGASQKMDSGIGILKHKFRELLYKKK